ncbi:MAG: type II toxin-antitoxin system RelE/ParE family toxin [Proteobacteria bacterium]|nr:type II toxin-antitoxin system RelE/ParE family toxin [Pseudomonadota bacterium]NOG61010.1 type II toxin-antitoxin system RelE/ParE family toxin [Pseudomonadota bacterium]
MIVNFLQEAEEEIIQASSYYQQQSSGLGIAFIHEVRKTCGLISESPKASSKVRNNIRRKLVRRFPFAVLYEIDIDSILVVAVAHQRREPGYWITRTEV